MVLQMRNEAMLIIIKSQCVQQKNTTNCSYNFDCKYEAMICLSVDDFYFCIRL